MTRSDYCRNCDQRIFLNGRGDWVHVDPGLSRGCMPGPYLTTAVARSTDPDTSWDAARSVTGIRESQKSVLAVLRRVGPVTDEHLIRAYQDEHRAGRVPVQSPSGIRSRRSELVRMGLVTDSGDRWPTVTGRKSIVWAAVSADTLATAVP